MQEFTENIWHIMSDNGWPINGWECFNNSSIFITVNNSLVAEKVVYTELNIGHLVDQLDIKGLLRGMHREAIAFMPRWKDNMHATALYLQLPPFNNPVWAVQMFMAFSMSDDFAIDRDADFIAKALKIVLSDLVANQSRIHAQSKKIFGDTGEDLLSQYASEDYHPISAAIVLPVALQVKNSLRGDAKKRYTIDTVDPWRAFQSIFNGSRDPVGNCVGTTLLEPILIRYVFDVISKCPQLRCQITIDPLYKEEWDPFAVATIIYIQELDLTRENGHVYYAVAIDGYVVPFESTSTTYRNFIKPDKVEQFHHTYYSSDDILLLHALTFYNYAHDCLDIVGASIDNAEKDRKLKEAELLVRKGLGCYRHYLGYYNLMKIAQAKNDIDETEKSGKLTIQEMEKSDKTMSILFHRCAVLSTLASIALYRYEHESHNPQHILDALTCIKRAFIDLDRLILSRVKHGLPRRTPSIGKLHWRLIKLGWLAIRENHDYLQTVQFGGNWVLRTTRMTIMLTNDVVRRWLRAIREMNGYVRPTVVIS